MRLGREEMFVGGVVALSFLHFTGWYTLLTVPISSFLWAYGGAANTSKSWRRLGVPIVLCGMMALLLKDWYLLLSIIPFNIVLRVGYGVPDGVDMGSSLGRWWTEALTGLKKPYSQITADNMKVVDLFVRGTIAFLIGLSMMPLAFVDITQYLMAVVMVTVGIPFSVYVIN